MLKSIHPLLNADVLYALRAMGHGDDLILSDTNFPADSVARQTRLGKLLRIDAPASVVVGSPGEIPDVQREVQKEIDAAEGKSWPMISIERFAFYERAKNAYCVIQTGERRFYGCFAFRKGVIPPDAA